MEALKIVDKKEPNKNTKNTTQKVDETLTEELFIAICSPIGSMKEIIIENIKDILKTNFNYDNKVIKLSKYIDKINITTTETTSTKNNTEIFNQYFNKIEKGNQIRKNNNNAFLAENAIQEIHLERLSEVKKKGIEEPKAEDFKSRRICYIIDSIKSKDELELFRKVYTENFYLISLFSSLDDRKNNLRNKGFKNSEIEEIIENDDKQNFNYGQNVRGTFVDGDFFMRVSEENSHVTNKKLRRFFDLIFESSIITPTVEEKSMYLAKSASGNSSCLSRQVGACIIDENNNTLSTGWNDVPKFGGNLYTSDYESLDNRCYKKGFCSNDSQKDKLVGNIIESLISDPEIKKLFEKKINGEENELNNSLIERVKNNLRNSKVKDLIEFSRSVHAEMHAIIQSSQTYGSQIINGKLFCTTYPCHNCARHIIAAGIKEVYYIEPYVKSLCLTLHNDAMTENEKIEGKVKILMFDGVAPRNYLTFFTNFAERKNKGKLIKRDLKKLKPKKTKSLQALSTLEQQAVHYLSERKNKTLQNEK
ncbi:Cytidine and deoxycytidylate deaminase zinc-binding region [Tenacibaculum mesophilum]|uniref:Deoxycytidylate deaminase n=1 Tax=Tenacibaculum mesophilum TaxID=104268 RepID=A0ABM7CG42_9FLAO|nr:anti-phage dCTP deaminase [Tenacibaculum mesophilum]AZJ32762.1 deoxycytidylate deaminase [Tenacibaculum mesophilum]QFS28011.1 deoxycytidylate deaminase [Tenacibaculum mesophilum]SHF74814.1 Cytidine and deoxycytidylate deaminase zinc-binding region [Tenacibaculum mesophilum]